MIPAHPATDIARLTADWDGERDGAGRPRVPDDVLESLRTITSEQAWHVLDEHGYPYQFAGGWRSTNPERPLVGRAVTALFLPARPDLDGAVEAYGRESGHVAGTQQNTWVIDTLVDGDVLVVDIGGKIREGTVIGDNLGTAIASRTHAGAVIDGGVRDLRGLRRLADATMLYRDTDPTPIRQVTLAGVNLPVAIGGVTVLPGDVVLGTESGVTFIPPRYAEEIVRTAREIDHRDRFGKLRIAEGTYTSAQIDVPDWDVAIQEDFLRWRSEAGEASR